MKFSPAPDDPEITGQFHRLVSENGVIAIGVYRVMYGFRVRAGKAKDLMGCTLDWCGGGNWQDVERLYSLAVSILSQREESPSCFDGLPTCSEVKPFFLDECFTKTLAEAAGPDLELIKLPPPPPHPLLQFLDQQDDIDQDGAE